MARIFTVDFNYDQKEYPALVKISAGQNFFSVTYHVPDTSLHHILPGGRVNYNNVEGFTTITGNNTVTLDLIESITNAVEEYLQLPQSAHNG
jgi:hypothetical protein